MVTKDGEGDKLGDWNCHIHTTIYKIEANKNLVIQHKELCLIFCNDLYGKIILRVHICIHMIDSLC